MESWLKSSGAKGLQDVELADFPFLGRGLKSLKNFRKEETVLSLPNNVLWTANKAYEDPLLGPVLKSLQPALSVDDTLALFILFVKSRASGYAERRSHVETMPKGYTSSIFCFEEELAVCEGSSLYAVTKQLETQIQEDYLDLVRRVFILNSELFPLDKFTIDDYKWALCTVWSRAMDFKLSNGTSLRLIAPFVDMLNHSSEVSQCHVYDEASGSLSVRAGKDYEVGDQVFIYYGSIPNNRLLRLYGFVIPGNSHDSYNLVLSTHDSAPFFAQKEKLWTSTGLDAVCTIPLTLGDPLPKNVLRYLRIQRMGEPDIVQALLGSNGRGIAEEKINDKNEFEILQFLVSSIDYLLEGFKLSLEKLEEQLTTQFYSQGSNAWAAAHVSIGEQKILRLARDTAADLLAKAESETGSSGEQCANCGKASVQLKMCARCKKVKYCGRECQVAHFQKHKATCRASLKAQGS